jgi:hypothetical protein
VTIMNNNSILLSVVGKNQLNNSSRLIERYPVRLTVLFMISSMMFLLNCMNDRPGNPFDYPPELIVVISDTLTSDTMAVSLASDYTDSTLFRFRLDSVSWSEFSNDTALSFTMLDDGVHTLDIECHYQNNEDSVSDTTITFSVNILPKVALYTVPRQIVFNKKSDTATIGIGIKDLPSCDRMHFVFFGTKVTSISLSEKVDTSDLVLFSKDSIADLLLKPGSDPFDENEEVLKVHVEVPKNVDTTFSFTCSARDTNNVAISVDTIRGCILQWE